METIAISKKIDPAMPLPDQKRMQTALLHPARWQILRALSTGEVLSVTQLAGAVGCTLDMSSKHLRVLKAAGMVVQKPNRCYAIPAAHQPAPGEPLLDYGHCVLRLDAAA